MPIETTATTGILKLSKGIFVLDAHIRPTFSGATGTITVQWQTSTDLAFTSPVNVGTTEIIIPSTNTAHVPSMPFCTATIDATAADVFVRAQVTAATALTNILAASTSGIIKTSAGGSPPTENATATLTLTGDQTITAAGTVAFAGVSIETSSITGIVVVTKRIEVIHGTAINGVDFYTGIKGIGVGDVRVNKITQSGSLNVYDVTLAIQQDSAATAQTIKITVTPLTMTPTEPFVQTSSIIASSKPFGGASILVGYSGNIAEYDVITLHV